MPPGKLRVLIFPVSSGLSFFEVKTFKYPAVLEKYVMLLLIVLVILHATVPG